MKLATTRWLVIFSFLKLVQRRLALCVSYLPCLLPTLCSTRLRICVSFTISWLSWDICWSTCRLALSTLHQSGRHWQYIMIHQHYLDIVKTTTEDITTSGWEIASPGVSPQWSEWWPPCCRPPSPPPQRCHSRWSAPCSPDCRCHCHWGRRTPPRRSRSSCCLSRQSWSQRARRCPHCGGTPYWGQLI